MSDAIEPINKHELALVQDRWSEALESFKNSDWPEETIAQWLDHAMAALKELDAERKELTGPLDRQMKATNKVFREAMQPLEDFKSLAKNKLAALALERDNVLRAAREALVANTSAEASVQALVTLTQETTPTAGLRTSYKWVPIVVDAQAIPREYLKVNDELLEEMGRLNAKHDYIDPIPGVRWDRVAVVSSSGRRK